MAARCVLLVAALLLVAGVAWPAHAADLVNNVDGSGSTIAAPLVLKLIEVMKSWTTPLIGMSYRSVGSAAGQAEFSYNQTAPSNDFSISDYGLDRSLYLGATNSGNPPVQIPFAMSQLAFYHSIPGIAGTGALKLDCQTLAKIFSGKTTRWDDPEISTLNPDLAGMLPSTPIIVLRRSVGCGSTYGMTNYFSRVCPSGWEPLAIGAQVPVWDAMLVNSIGVTSARDMAQVLSVTPNALGYLDTGHAQSAGLKEVAITNADGVMMPSTQANNSPSFLVNYLNAATPDLTPFDDWSNFTIIAEPGPTMWPIHLVSYVQTRQNLTWLESEGSLLQLFLKAVLSDAGSSFMTQLGYTPLPSSLRASLAAFVRSLAVSTTSRQFKYEQDVDAGPGGNDWVVSPNRQNYLYQTVFDMEQTVGQLKHNARVGYAYQVHGSGSAAPAIALRQVMQQLTEQAREPIQATYRAVGGVQAQVEFADYATNFNQYNQFKVGDAPLPSSEYYALQPPGGPGVVQIPFAAAALGVYYNQQIPGFTPLKLDACKLAYILNGTLDSWSDVLGSNASTNPSLMQHRVVVYIYAGNHTSMLTIDTYLRRACPFFMGLSSGCSKCTSRFVKMLSTGVPEVVDITSPDLMVEALQQTQHSLGFVQSNFAEGAGLFAAQLPVTGTTTYLSPSPTTAINALAAITATLPSSWTGDWSSVSTIDLRQAPDPAWPMTQIMFFWVYQNMTAYGYSGPLTKALINYTLSTDMNEGQAIIAAQGLSGLPPTWTQLANSALQTLILDPLLEDWRVEQWGEISSRGQGLFTFSANRANALAASVRTLQQQLADMSTLLAATLPTVVRVVVNTDAAVVVRQALDLLEKSTNQPIMTALEFESSQAAAVSRLSAPAYAHIAILDQPLLHSQYTALAINDYQQAVQVPIFIRSVSLLVKGGSSNLNLTMDACAVAYLLRGDVTSWRDSRLTGGWDSSTVNQLPTSDFTVITASKSSGDYQAMKRYAALGCPSVVVANDNAVLQTGSGTTEDLLNTLMSQPAYAAIGIASRFLVDVGSLATASSIQEVALKSKQGQFVHSSLDRDASPNLSNYQDSYTALLDTALAGGLPNLTASGPGSSLLISWSEWNAALVWASVDALTYPVVRADFMVLTADLSRYNATGGAIAGVAAFLASDQLQNQSSPIYFIYPGLDALGPGARSFAQQELSGSLFNFAPGVKAWPVGNTSALVQASVNGGSLDPLGPAILTNSWTDEGQQALSTGVASTVALQAANAALLSYRSALADTQKRADLAYSVAVAAIVLGLLLSLAALGLAAYAVCTLRRRGSYEGQRMISGGGSGGSVTGTASLINGMQHVSSGPVPEVLLTQASNGRKKGT